MGREWGGGGKRAEPRHQVPWGLGLHSSEVCKGHRLKAQRSSWEREQSGQAPLGGRKERTPGNS